MANRRPQTGGRRMDFARNDRGKNFGRAGVSPWQTTGPTTGLPNLLPLSGGPTEATLALASNIINLLQPRQNPVPSLLDMPIRRDFGPDMGRFDRGYGPNRMGNQGNFRRTGNYNRAGERINNRKPYRPSDGQRQPNKSSLKKDADSKAKPKESEQDKDANKEEKEGETSEKTDSKEETEGKKEAPKTRYDDINSALLKCHICNKSMWDGRSFENHLSGRAHAIMMQKTAQSYALTADTMRQEFKIREMKRTRKSGQQPPRDFYCAMCDMYAGDGAVHRTTVGHRKLKKYLHPTCTCCHKEMPTRIELDEHRLTAEHLRNIQDKQEVITKPKPEVMVISTLSMEQSYLREDRQRRPRTSHADKDKETTENGPKEGEEQEQTEENKEQEEGETVESSEEKLLKKGIDSENTILDYKEGDDLTDFTSDMIPVYNTERGVGRSFLSEFKCVQCKLCRKLLDSEETAEVHLRTWRHHQLFTRLLGDKAPSKQRDESVQECSGKRPLNAEENGNWKRRKTAADDENGHEDDDDKHDDDDKLDDEKHGHDGKHGDDGEEPTVKQEVNDGNNEDDTADMATDDLEDWEQSVDEILQDEKNNTNELQIKEEPEEEPPKEEEPSKEEEKESSSPNTPTNSKVKAPRGRGRGRGRPARY